MFKKSRPCGGRMLRVTRDENRLAGALGMGTTGRTSDSGSGKLGGASVGTGRKRIIGTDGGAARRRRRSHSRA